MFRKAALALCLGLLAPILARATPLNTLIPGSMAPAIATPQNYECTSDYGPSSLRKRSTGIGGIQEISFGAVVIQFANSQTEWAAVVFGLGVMTFKTETSGIVEFPYQYSAVGAPPTITAPTFTNYKETYTEKTGTVVVSFTLKYPFCSLPIQATYLVL
jgi:hypothetical protein